MAFYITITLRQDNCVQISIFVHYAQGKTADPGRCLEKQRTTIERQIEEEEQLLLELEVNLDSMNINVPTLPAIGNTDSCVEIVTIVGTATKLISLVPCKSVHRTHTVDAKISIQNIFPK